MSATSRRRSNRFSDRRQQLLDAAAPLFNQKGLGGTTLAEVGAAVGMLTTGVTYYYRRKDDLAAACLLRTIAAYRSRIAEAEDESTPERRLAAFIDGCFIQTSDVAAGHAPPLMAFFDIRSLTGAAVEPVFSAFSDMFRDLRALMRPAPLQPALPQPEENARVHLTLSMVLWARTWALRYDPIDYPRLGKRMSDILINGLSVSGAWSPAPLGLPESPRPEANLSHADFLRAATETINDFGYHGASVDAIAARLGVTKGAFYHHVSTKDDLVLSCFERSFRTVRQIQIAGLNGDLTPWDRLGAVTAALVRRQLGGEPLLRHMAVAATHADLRGELRDAMERQTEHFAGLVADAAADGDIRPVDPAVAAQMVAETINAASDLPRWTGGRLDAEAAIRTYVSPLFAGGVFRPADVTSR